MPGLGVCVTRGQGSAVWGLRWSNGVGIPGPSDRVLGVCVVCVAWDWRLQARPSGLVTCWPRDCPSKAMSVPELGPSWSWSPPDCRVVSLCDWPPMGTALPVHTCLGTTVKQRLWHFVRVVSFQLLVPTPHPPRADMPASGTLREPFDRSEPQTPAQAGRPAGLCVAAGGFPPGPLGPSQPAPPRPPGSTHGSLCREDRPGRSWRAGRALWTAGGGARCSGSVGSPCGA